MLEPGVGGLSEGGGLARSGWAGDDVDPAAGAEKREHQTLLVGAEIASRRDGGGRPGRHEREARVGAGGDQLQGVLLGTYQFGGGERRAVRADDRQHVVAANQLGSELPDLVGADVRSGGQLGADLPHDGALVERRLVPGDPACAEYVAGQRREVKLSWLMPAGQQRPHIVGGEPQPVGRRRPPVALPGRLLVTFGRSGRPARDAGSELAGPTFAGWPVRGGLRSALGEVRLDLPASGGERAAH
ncbi:MAG: hypothetical protein NVS3B26_15060 [Mycobacteriales bacterium]